MKALRALVLACTLLPFIAAGASLEETFAPQGQLIFTRFASAPFPHPDRTNGHTYENKRYPAAEHYSDNTVALFVPHGFRETGTVDFVIHFHGWNNTVAGTLATFHLVEQLVASGKNAILVIPEGPHNAPDSFGGKLEDPDGFKRFMAEVVATLRARADFKKDFTIGRIILSGHSGGYHVIAGILDRGGLPKNADEVWLFDALYGRTDSFLAWADRTHGRLLNIYTDHGGTREESEKFQARLTARATPFLASEETALTDDALRKNKFVFIHTDLAHNEVAYKRDEFALFLKTSDLTDCAKANNSLDRD
jgi:hypothetical protein